MSNKEPIPAELWEDKMLTAICAAVQDAGITDLRPGDNLLPNAQAFRYNLLKMGYAVIPKSEAPTTVDWNAIIEVLSNREKECFEDYRRIGHNYFGEPRAKARWEAADALLKETLEWLQSLDEL
jgi:hypothetical protein